MRVLFLRHGESEDDTRNELGGWSQRPPTTKGLNLATMISKELAINYNDISVIYSSPLKRALLFAKYIGSKLGLPVKENIYLTERNTYGLINGMTIGDVSRNYPELIDRFERQEFLPGSERYEDFIDRVSMLLDFLENHKHKGTILCITHGYLITTLAEEFLGLTRDKIKYGALLECKLTSKKLSLTKNRRITFIKAKDENQLITRKFKKR